MIESKHFVRLHPLYFSQKKLKWLITPLLIQNFSISSSPPPLVISLDSPLLWPRQNYTFSYLVWWFIDLLILYLRKMNVTKTAAVALKLSFIAIETDHYIFYRWQTPNLGTDGLHAFKFHHSPSVVNVGNLEMWLKIFIYRCFKIKSFETWVFLWRVVVNLIGGSGT